MHTLKEPFDELAQGALFAVGHSGGKDSSATLIHLLALGIPPTNILVVHASLGHIEWPGALEMARDHAARAGAAFVVAQAKRTLFDMVIDRYNKRPEVPSWPSAAHRTCTSDLKRGPCSREIRRYANEHGFTRVVNCLGLRAQESPARRKRPAWSLNPKETNSKRVWHEWLPIHDWTTQKVFRAIEDAGEKLHPAYAENDRLSCVFCIFGSVNDLQHGARQNPDLAREYIELEEVVGYTFHMSRVPLAELLQQPIAPKSELPKQLDLLDAA